jgi:membrane associated rhomboid family serine protease
MMVARKGSLTTALILANVAISLVVFSMPEALRDSFLSMAGFSSADALLVYPWFTSLFIHASASHLFFNMLGLYFFGRVLEPEVKRKWFLAIYFASGLLGNLVFLFTTPGIVVGASGAIFGLMGAAMLTSPTKLIHLYIIPLPLGVVALTFLLVETFVVYFQMDFGQVAHYSHVAGVVTGATFALFYDPKKALKGALVLGASLVLLLVFAPVMGLVATLASAALSVVDFVVGLAIYGAAGLLSFLWA